MGNLLKRRSFLRLVWKLQARGASLFLLTLSLSFGIAALVAVETFSRRIENTVTRDSKTILAADFQIRAWRPFDEKVWKAVSEERARGDVVVLKDLVTSLVYEGPGKPWTSNISLRAVEGEGYPFYGNFVTEPALLLSELTDTASAFLDASFRARGLKPGSKIRVGTKVFTVRAFVVEEPQSILGAFSLGPRVYISSKRLEETGLTQGGARIFHRLLVKSSLSPKEFEKKFRAVAPELHWRLTTPKKASRQVERILERMSGFLGFVGVSSLFLGAMGLFMVFRSQFLRRLPSYLTLRCLGARSGLIESVAALGAAQVAFLGAIVGIALGVGLESLLTRIGEVNFGIELSDVSYGPSILWGIVLALACVIVSAWLPLREILRVPVANVLRDSEGSLAGLKLRDGIFALFIAALVILFVAPDLKMSLFIFGGLCGSLILLLFLSRALLNLFPRRGRNFVVRHTRLQLVRRLGRTQLLVIAVGFSWFFLCLILLLGRNLRSQLNIAQRDEVPNLFALNVPPEARTRLSEIIPGAQFVPFAQARITELRGREIVEGEAPPDEGEERFYQTREYVITKRSKLSAGEDLVDGRSLFSEGKRDSVRVSLERSFADRIGLKIGDEFSLDLAGVRMNAVVQSLRRVNWFNFEPNFFMVLHPDDIEGAPVNYVAFLRVPKSEFFEIQSRVLKEFPQLSLLDSEALARRILEILEQLALSIYSVILLSLLGGAFVFLGIFLSRKPEILRDVGLWRCLGLSHHRILKLYAFEALFLGLLSSLASYIASCALVYSICRWVIDVPFEGPRWYETLAVLFLPSFICALGSLLMTRPLLREPAQALFRLSEETY